MASRKQFILYIVRELALALAVMMLASIMGISAGLAKQYLYGNIVESIMTVAFESAIIAYGLGRYVAYRKNKFVKKNLCVRRRK